MGASFGVAALVPIVPYLFLGVSTALWVSVLVSGLMLFAMGALKSRWTGRHWLPSGLEIFGLGAVAGIAGYLFGTSYDGITVLSPDPKQVGTNRMDVVTNGRKLSQELLDGVKAKGEILLPYEYVKPGEDKPVRKIGYAVAVHVLTPFSGFEDHRCLFRLQSSH